MSIKKLLICMILPVINIIGGVTGYWGLCYAEGKCMLPTMNDKGLVFSLPAIDIDYGDIVVIKVEGVKDKLLVKRVVAMPNDTVEIRDGFLFINDVGQEERYVKLPTHMKDMPKITLKDNEYFYLGDNRDNSLDARWYGPCKRADIKSEVLFWI